MVTMKIYFIYRLDIRVNRLDCSQLAAMKNSGTLLPWRVAEDKKMEMIGLKLNQCPVHDRGDYVQTHNRWECPVCGAYTNDGWYWDNLEVHPDLRRNLATLFNQLRGTQPINNPGAPHYASCGCSEKRFRFFSGNHEFVETQWEVRYWVATDPSHNHNMKHIRIYMVTGLDTLKKVS